MKCYTPVEEAVCACMGKISCLFVFVVVIVVIMEIKMREEERLAAVVSSIDHDVAVVPRGAFIRTPLGEVVQNKTFQGVCVCK